jgi:hypothetical protein
MLIAIIGTVLVVGFVVGTIASLRSSSQSGMPSKEVLERATQRARELDAEEKSGGGS